MKSAIVFLLLSAGQLCFGQTDTNLLATGDWSEIVHSSKLGPRGPALRGRLLIYDDRAESAAHHARVYLELQHVFAGAWYDPVEIYYDTGAGKTNLFLEVCDGRGQRIRSIGGIRWGAVLGPCWLTLPCDATMRLRADECTLGPATRPDGLEILVESGTWIIPGNATNAFYLSGSFTPGKGLRSSLLAWEGTLKLPSVRIPAKNFEHGLEDMIREILEPK